MPPSTQPFQLGVIFKSLFSLNPDIKFVIIVCQFYPLNIFNKLPSIHSHNNFNISSLNLTSHYYNFLNLLG